MEVVLCERTNVLDLGEGVSCLSWTAHQLAFVASLAEYLIGDIHRAILQLLHDGGSLCVVNQAVETILEPCVSGPVVIIRGSAQGIQLRTIAFRDDLLACIGIGAYAARGIVKADFKVVACEGNALLALLGIDGLPSC